MPTPPNIARARSCGTTRLSWSTMNVRKLDMLYPHSKVRCRLTDDNGYATTPRFARAPCLGLDPRRRTCSRAADPRLLQNGRIPPQLHSQRHRCNPEARTGEWVRGRRDRRCRRLYPEEPGAISRGRLPEHDG